MNAIDYTERIEELTELLQCPYKLSLIDIVLIKEEINELIAEMPKPKNYGRKNPKILNKHFNMYKDKAKHGCYHYKPSRRRQYLLKQANKTIRYSHLFGHNGSGYKRCFNLPWELW